MSGEPKSPDDLLKQYAAQLTSLLNEKSALSQQVQSAGPEERQVLMKRRRVLNREIKSRRHEITRNVFLTAVYAQPHNVQNALNGAAVILTEAALPDEEQAEILECVVQNLPVQKSTQEESA